MANLLLFLVFAGLTGGVIVFVFILATRGKTAAQPAAVTHRTTSNDDSTPITQTSGPTVNPPASDDTNFNPGGGSFGGGGADAGWTDNTQSSSDSSSSDSSSGSDSSSSSDSGSDSGSSSSDS